MSDEKQEKYLSKQVKLGGHNVTLYSLNGLTWVSDPSGLTELMERLENARVSFNDPKGAAGDKNKQPKEKFKPRGPRGARPTMQADAEEDEIDPLEQEDLDVESDDKEYSEESKAEDSDSGSKGKKFAKPALPAKNISHSPEKKGALSVIAGKGGKPAAKPTTKVVAKAKKPAAAAKTAKAKAKPAPKKAAPKAKKGKK